MDNIGNTCIISAGIGGWYAQGVSRLERSLMFHGYAGQVLTWKDEYPEGCPTHEENPYAVKIFAFNEAFNRGYKCVMWLDASLWAIKNPHHIFDIINDNGIFAFRSGYNCAQTCTDNLLYYAGFSRDEAEQLPEIASGMVGINIDNPNCIDTFWYRFILSTTSLLFIVGSSRSNLTDTCRFSASAILSMIELSP